MTRTIVFSIHDHHDAHHTMYFVSAYKCVLWMDGKFVSSGSNFCEMSIYVFICAHFKFPEHPVKTTGRRYELSQPAKIYLLSKSKKKRPPEAKKRRRMTLFLKKSRLSVLSKTSFLFDIDISRFRKRQYISTLFVSASYLFRIHKEFFDSWPSHTMHWPPSASTYYGRGSGWSKKRGHL